jgi:hypothetical protein
MSKSERKSVKITKTEARQTMLAIQGLFPPRKWQGKRGVKAFFNQVRSIQFDPINLVGRNPDLVLQSRVIDYKPSTLDGLLYEDRYLVDNWDKMASISLAEDWPYFSRHRSKMEDMFGVPSDVVMSLAPIVIKQIRENGPQSSLDFQFEEKTDWSWGPTRVTRASLEGLYKMGKLGVHHRINNRRYFDLIENLLPENLLSKMDPNQDLEAYQRWHVLRRIGAIGLAHPNAGEQWGGMIGVKTPRRREIIKELIADGNLFMVEIDGLEGDQFYLRSEDQSILERSRKGQTETGAAFIAPLDNLLWDRKTIQRLFDFNYVWEVYKPKKKREYGYYVLPVLYGDRFVARFDPGFDKKTGCLTIKDWWWEMGIEVHQDMVNSLKECLKDFLVYLDANDLEFSKDLLQVGDLDWLQDI